MVGEIKRQTACLARRQFRCGCDDRPESPLSAEPHRARDRAADRACAFESCGGFRAALPRLRRGVANHSTGHGRRGGVLGVGVLGEAAFPFSGRRVYGAGAESRVSAFAPMNAPKSRALDTAPSPLCLLPAIEKMWETNGSRVSQPHAQHPARREVSGASSGAWDVQICCETQLAHDAVWTLVYYVVPVLVCCADGELVLPAIPRPVNSEKGRVGRAIAKMF